MPIIKCTIDRNAINKWTKHQRELGEKIILVDDDGLRLAINARSSSWNYNYRKRGVDYQGKRQRTWGSQSLTGPSELSSSNVASEKRRKRIVGCGGSGFLNL